MLNIFLRDYFKFKEGKDIRIKETIKDKIDRFHREHSMADRDKKRDIEMKDRYYDKYGEEHIRVKGYENMYYKSGHKCKCKAEETGVSFESMKEEEDNDNEYIENVAVKIQINIENSCDKLIKIIFKSLEGEEKKVAYNMIKENPYSNDIIRYLYKKLSDVVYNSEDGFDRDELTEEVRKVIERSISNE